MYITKKPEGQLDSLIDLNLNENIVYFNWVYMPANKAERDEIVTAITSNVIWIHKNEIMNADNGWNLVAVLSSGKIAIEHITAIKWEVSKQLESVVEHITSVENTMKDATEKDILLEAFNLCIENKTTTNLEIKESMRKKNFYINQDQVKEVMSNLAELNSFTCAFVNMLGKTVRQWTYVLPDIYNMSPYQPNTDQNLDDVIKDMLNITNDDDVVTLERGPISDDYLTPVSSIVDSSNTWKVFHKSTPSLFVEHDGSLTRDQARSEYAKTFKVNRDDVRAKKKIKSLVAKSI